MKARIVFAVLAPLMFSSCTKFADDNAVHEKMAKPASAAGSAKAASAWIHSATGTVESIDLEASRITLSHGPVETLGWPAMTMAFKLADPALARGLKEGQSVSFTFDKQGDDYRITAIAPQSTASGAKR